MLILLLTVFFRLVLTAFQVLSILLLDTFFSLNSKHKPLQKNYRKYKHFNNDSFNEDLKLAFNNTDIQTCEEFEEIFMKLLDHHAPLKKKTLRANNAPYLT